MFRNCAKTNITQPVYNTKSQLNKIQAVSKTSKNIIAPRNIYTPAEGFWHDNCLAKRANAHNWSVTSKKVAAQTPILLCGKGLVNTYTSIAYQLF